VEAVEQGVGSSVARVDRVHAFDVTVVAEQSHQRGLCGFALIHERLEGGAGMKGPSKELHPNFSALDSSRFASLFAHLSPAFKTPHVLGVDARLRQELFSDCEHH
jgi:hypothetical protein